MKPDTRLLDKYKAALEQHRPEYIIGIDEVGWGAIAGPLVLACIVYKPTFAHSKVKDSKSFTTERSREAAYTVVNSTKEYLDVHVTDPARLGVVGAGAAIQAALFTLATKAVLYYPTGLLVLDGVHVIKGIKQPQLCLDKADTFVPAVSAASIVAKVFRDQHMSSLSVDFPEYEWHQNKGYPTQRHTQLLKTHGVSEHHRMNIPMIRDAFEAYGTYEQHHYGDPCED